MLSCVAVIPTFNRKHHLRNLLDQLALQSPKLSNVTFSVVVVVDGSTDGTLEMLDTTFPEIHVVRGDGNWWYTESMNQGFEYAKTLRPDLFLTLNDDIKLEENYLTSILTASQQMEHKAIIGSLSITNSTPHKIFFAGIKEISWITGRQTKYHRPYSEVDQETLKGLHISKVLPGRGMLIPYEVLKKLDGFDPKLIQYGSDDDFCLRAQKQGIEVMISWDSVIFCFDKMTGKGSPRLKQSFLSYLLGMFDSYSPSSIRKEFRLIRKNTPLIFIPVALVFKIAQIIYPYFKYQRGFGN